MDTQQPRDDVNQLRIDVTASPTDIWVRIAGEIDVANRMELLAVLAAVDFGSSAPVYVDLRRLTFCDAAGCQLLLALERRARKAGREISFLGARPMVRRVLTLLSERTLTFV